MPYSLSKWLYLSTKNIDVHIPRTAPGVYTLDIQDGPYKICYVGRSDDDLNGCLKDWVNSKYSYFQFDYATSPMNAFQKECEIYHDHNPRDNTYHPDRPAGTNWKCPNCDKFD